MARREVTRNQAQTVAGRKRHEAGVRWKGSGLGRGKKKKRVEWRSKVQNDSKMQGKMHPPGKVSKDRECGTNAVIRHVNCIERKTVFWNRKGGRTK